jgi:uncharacterized GH25 family protein
MSWRANDHRGWVPVDVAPLVLVLALLTLPRSAAAHDFWLYPTRHELVGPTTIDIRVCLGQPGEVDELERRPSHVKRFEAHGDRVVPVTGAAKQTPAGRVELSGAGIHTLVYESRHSLVELAPRKFDAYLVEEGLLEIIAERERAGETDHPGIESFARYAKALVRVGGDSSGYDRRLGLTAELVATVDPFVGGEAGSLEFQLWYLDQPRAGARVDLFELDAKNLTPIAHATTDRDGRVRFPSPGPGRWLVASTVMRRASYPIDADWESSWASLSFEVVSGDGMVRTRPARWSRPALVAALAAFALLVGGWYWTRRRRPGL